jgi:hypothetical protein
MVIHSAENLLSLVGFLATNVGLLVWLKSRKVFFIVSLKENEHFMTQNKIMLN